MNASSSLGISTDLTELTTDLVAAYVGNHVVPVSDLPLLIADVHAALLKTSEPAAAVEIEKPKPVVPIRKSIEHECITCLEDGLRFKSLRRHVLSAHGMTPDEYRTRWGLPSDYPMVAPAYTAKRSELAKQNGLGQKVKRKSKR